MFDYVSRQLHKGGEVLGGQPLARRETARVFCAGSGEAEHGPAVSVANSRTRLRTLLAVSVKRS